MIYSQDDPFCVQIEPTEGCNLRCSFCGINGIRVPGKNEFRFMSPELARKISREITDLGWTSRIEIAMHGEPTMNPDLGEIISCFRQGGRPLGYILMESNGGGLVADPVPRILALFRAGLSCLALDQYNGINLVPKIQERMAETLGVSRISKIRMLEDIRLYTYPECGPEGNPHQRSRKRRLVFIAPIDTETKGTHSSLNNHSGCGSPPDFSLKEKNMRCAKPFREISIRWDGSVAICCNDWRGRYVIGNCNTSSLYEIWHSERFYAARRRLYAKRRDFGPCLGCNAISYRTGLLPDSYGKTTMDPPTEDDDRIIAEALADGPLTTPVRRPWEG